MEVGFLGLGGMGTAMARNLLKAGHRVTVWKRSPEAAKTLAVEGAIIARSAQEAAGQAVVLSMLADDEAMDAVFFGSGALDAIPGGGIHVSFATISVAMSERLREAHEARGQVYVAAPVFGRPDAAAAAKLFIVAAGAIEAIETLRPVFEVLGQRLFVAGDRPSQANLVKLSGNFLITCVIESLAEVFALNEKGGVDPRLVYEVLTETLFSAPIYKTYGSLILDRKFTPAGFKLPLGLKDNRLLQQAAEALNVPLPFAGIIRDKILATLANGDTERDWSAFSLRAAEDAGLGRNEDHRQKLCADIE